MTEDPCKPAPRGIVKLLLPNVARIPLPVILKLRYEYYELFTRFQNELSMFIRKSDESDSESKIIDLLLTVDEGIHKLRIEFERIDRRIKLERKGLFYSLGVLSLMFVVPEEVYRSLAALMGTTSVLRSLRNMKLQTIERSKLEEHPFYLPYKLTTISRQFEE